MAILLDVISFTLKGLVVVTAFAVTAGILLIMIRRGRREGPRLDVTHLNRQIRDFTNTLRGALLEGRELRGELKRRRREAKKRRPKDRRLFVLDFHGDIAATAVTSLREEITLVLAVARPQDEILLRLESSGGAVHAYGLAASQLARIRQKGIRLTICVDKVAASGGYMMACLADEIVAAPFAIIGSIGVVAPVPNLHRFLDEHRVDYEEMTAGEFKRTVSLLAEISAEGRKKFQEQLEDTHGLFKEFVGEYRKGLDMARVTTGEYWLGRHALSLKLVDRLGTSDDTLVEWLERAEIYQVSYRPAQPWRRRFAEAVTETTSSLVARGWNAAMSLSWPSAHGTPR